MKHFTLTLAIALQPLTSAWSATAQNRPVPQVKQASQAEIDLGRQLFFDPRLSKTATVSCNSCHNVMAGGEDGRPTATGVFGKQGGRSSPTVWNATFYSVQFWDGRANTLEDQAKGPMTNPVEMGMENHALVVERLGKIPGYRSQFEKVYGKTDPLTIDNVVKAIASYERTLVALNSPYDRYLHGDKAALTPLAKKGLALVQSVGCVSCHSGAHFAGPALPIGSGFFQKFPVFPNQEIEKKYGFTKDSGRFEATKKEEDKNLWRVPSWRNIALTAPYFHNGSVAKLDDAVRVMAKLQLNRDLSSQETKEIVAFLESLTGEFPKQTMPRLPALPTETIIQ